MPKLMSHLKPKTFGQCEKTNCYRCQVFLEGTVASISFYSKFSRDNCWTRNNLPRKFKNYAI